MRIVRHDPGGGPRFAVVQGAEVVDFEGAPDSTTELIIDWIETQPPPPGGDRYSLADTRVLSPVDTAGKLLAIGLNYRDHVEEAGLDMPTRPLAFAKLASSIIGPDDVIRWHEDVTAEVDFEAELAVVIGQPALRVSTDEALSRVFGYTCLNDVSARDIQFSESQWTRSKSIDTFCPIGPWLVTSDEIADPQDLRVRCRVSGELLQDGHTSQMVFSVAELISFLSHSFVLLPGDVIATGTPHGVGAFRKPPRWLVDGDDVEVDIEGVGVLRNRVEVIKAAEVV